MRVRDAGTWIVDSQDSGYKHEECAVTATLSLILVQSEQTQDDGHWQFCFNAQYFYRIKLTLLINLATLSKISESRATSAPDYELLLSKHLLWPAPVLGSRVRR